MSIQTRALQRSNVSSAAAASADLLTGVKPSTVVPARNMADRILLQTAAQKTLSTTDKGLEAVKATVAEVRREDLHESVIERALLTKSQTESMVQQTGTVSDVQTLIEVSASAENNGEQADEAVQVLLKANEQNGQTTIDPLVKAAPKPADSNNTVSSPADNGTEEISVVSPSEIKQTPIIERLRHNKVPVVFGLLLGIIVIWYICKRKSV